MRQLTQIDAPQGGALVNSICAGCLCGVPRFRLIGRMVSDIMTVSVNQAKRQEGEKMEKEQNKRWSTKRRVEREMTSEELCNRFRIFYSLRELWKKQGNSADDLYKILPISRTLYTQILGGRPVDLSSEAEQMKNLTDIPARYWDGYQGSVIQLNSWSAEEQNAAWRKLANLRRHTGGEKGTESKKSAEQSNLEAFIKNKLFAATVKDTLQGESEMFKRLFFFASYRQKQTEQTSMQILSDIEKAIQKCSRRTLEQTDGECLHRHYELIKEYSERVQAVMLLRGWDKTAK